MRKMSTRMLVEAGMMIALAQILSYLKVYEGPNGGSVTAGSMVPILFYAVRWGVRPGILAGVVYGILQFILGPMYSTHILCILLDYIIPFGLLGLAGLLKKSFAGVLAGVFIGILGRFISHVLSGVILWASYAGDTNPWIFSIGYNSSYLLPELIISLILVGILYKTLKNLPNN
ncbi:energy-coupled thiamine transporter ThiT [Crassaminicella profunda]|uniref:energy-coupled thiamine transporter ThiT n=1 Tax=Crassaminicella profunda TaxID=1286698 RepID=UPI001CA63316|nr:energy-coupled thiamine transporter ThiT [Crassaminicella profunda]QZY56276.1 energy-coupled thiamine transporter ThiT [Crassaminicella profunda]